jgi:hypothetical protein
MTLPMRHEPDKHSFHGFQITRAGLKSRTDGRPLGASVVVWVRAATAASARADALGHVETELAKLFDATLPAAVEIEALGTSSIEPALPEITPGIYRTGFALFGDA